MEQEEARVIRFNCPNCNRPYELPPALAFLPLVCKQCGQRVTPPANTPDAPAPSPPPQPKPIVADPPPKATLPVAQIVAPPPAKAAVPIAKPPTAKPITPAKLAIPPSEDNGVLVTTNAGGPTAASLSDAARPRPAELDGVMEPDINLDLLGPAPPPAPKRVTKPPEPEAPPEPRPEPTLLPFIADLIVFVALVVIGMVLGEQFAGKKTGTVLSESGSATKFPPVDLLMWGGPPVIFGLIYLLLGARKRTVGEWLRRRGSS